MNFRGRVLEKDVLMHKVWVEPAGQTRTVHLERHSQAIGQVFKYVLVMVEEEQARVRYCIDKTASFITGDRVVLYFATSIYIQGEPLVGPLADKEEYPRTCHRSGGLTS